MTYIWAPKGGAETGMKLSALPSDIAYNVKQVVKKVDLKVGLNVIGRMEITKTSKFGKLLTKVGAFKKGLPLVGKLSPKIFHPGSGSSIKNEILDHLNIKMSLPTLKIPGVDKFVTFTGGHMTLKGKSPKGVRGIYFDFGGDAKLSGHGSLEVDVEFDRTAGGKTDFWVTAAGPVKMSDVPGIKDIPNAGKFELDTLKISKHGIEANTKLGGKSVDIALFTGSGWNAAITQKNFSFTEVIPGLSKTPLKHITFPSATVVISKDGIAKHFGDLSPIAQDALKAIYSKPGDFVQLPKGLTFIAGFHPKHAGAMKKAVKGIGVHDEVMLQGTIGGMFGGTPLVKLKGSLKAGKPASMPKFMKFAKDVDVDFFLTVLKSEQDFDFELGIGIDVQADIHGDKLTFGSKVKVQVMDEGFGIDVEGQMKGIWHKPFKIPGFSISDVTLEVGTQEDGAIKLGFKGSTTINNDKFSMAGDGEFLPEALGAPQAFAFKASADKVDMFFLEEIAFNMVAKAAHLPIQKIPQPTFKKVKFAFATPGASDPDLGLVSEGFALAGTLNFLGKELGSINAAVGPTSGISIKGKLNNFHLGPLELKKNDLDVQVPFKKLPSFHIHADLEFLGIKDRFKLDATSKTITLSVSDELGPEFQANFDLALRGLDLNSAKVDPKTADFFVKGKFVADFAKFFRDDAKKDLNEVFAELTKVFQDGEKAVDDAQAKVDKLNGKINAERAKVRREKAKAEAKVTHAENRVNKLNGDLDHAWKKYHHCHGWKKLYCKAKWGIEIGGLKASVKVADGVLDAVRSAIKHFPVDLDPRVAILLGARDLATAALDVAKEAIKGLEDLEGFLKKALDALADALGKTLGH